MAICVWQPFDQQVGTQPFQSTRRLSLQGAVTCENPCWNVRDARLCQISNERLESDALDVSQSSPEIQKSNAVNDVNCWRHGQI